MRTFITKMSIDSLKFVVPLILGAFIFSLYGGFGLLAAAVSIMLLNYINYIWTVKQAKNNKAKVEVTKK